MPTNIEIKAKATDWERQLKAAQGLADKTERLVQEDTFFNCRFGRLKLRDLGQGKESYLVFYQRDDQSGPKSSDFEMSPAPDPASTKILLSKALGQGKTVRKKRTVLMVGQTRVHFDDVEGLGKFIELEVCLKPGQSPRDGEKIARDLMKRLGIEESVLLKGAYVEMLG